MRKKGFHDSPWRAAPILLALACCASPPPAAAPAPESPARDGVDYLVVVTGRELLAGAYADGHTFFLARTLRPLGLNCVGSLSIDDRPHDIEAALRFAPEAVPLVIVTGGLGPTDNDITREALSEFTGIPLQEDAATLKELKRRYGGRSGKLRPNMRRQTRVPVRGTCLKNPHGTAVGLVFEQEKRVIVALPGPPRELQPMVRDELVPYLNRRFGTRMPGCSVTLRFVGLGQSQISQTIKEHVTLPPGTVLSSTFEASRVDFTFSLPKDTPGGRARLEELKRGIARHLGDNLYAEDDTTLEQCVLDLLRKRGATLTLAESGSGGALAAALNGADGAGRIVTGATVASDEEGLRRMLGVEDARWTAEASVEKKAGLLAAAAAGKSWAVAVGGIRGEGDRARWVPVAIRKPDGGLSTQRVPIRDRYRLVTHLLDLLRRQLR